MAGPTFLKIRIGPKDPSPNVAEACATAGVDIVFCSQCYFLGSIE